MDMNIFWQQLGLRKNLNNSDIQYALAVFAYEYIERDSKEIKQVVRRDDRKNKE